VRKLSQPNTRSAIGCNSGGRGSLGFLVDGVHSLLTHGLYASLKSGRRGILGRVQGTS